MNLRDRLRLLKASGAARAEAARSSSPLCSLQREMPSAAPSAAPRPARLGGLLEGYLCGTASGDAFYVEQRFPVNHRHGPLPLGYLLRLDGGVWEKLGRVPPDFDMRRALFFDTETTGLAGGTGTYAFLVGLGFFDGEQFVVRQYFMRDYPDEEPMLAALEGDLSGFTCLVSFNGKSFDWPLMETRFRLSRRRAPLSGAPHLDLLHPARRIWRERLETCSLQSLEAGVLGVRRQGDVPGHLIPSLYFDYLRTGDLQPLLPVIRHNRLDILSLVSLAGWMGHVLTDPLGAAPDGELLSGDDLYALGRLHEARGRLVESVACFEAARQRGTDGVSQSALLRRLAAGYKRLREQEQAVELWAQMAASEDSLSIYPFVELAKYYEHVTRTYDLAAEMAEQALAIAQKRRSLAGAGDPAALREIQALQHRLERIRRKQGRTLQA